MRGSGLPLRRGAEADISGISPLVDMAVSIPLGSWSAPGLLGERWSPQVTFQLGQVVIGAGAESGRNGVSRASAVLVCVWG
jgi:hypothetical protein